MKFHEKKDELPPRACKPSKSEKNNVQDMGLKKLKTKTIFWKWAQKHIQTHLYKRRRTHKRAVVAVVVAVAVAAVVVAVVAAVAVVTAAARWGGGGGRRRRHHRHGRHHCHHHRGHRHRHHHRHHRTPVFASTFVEVHLEVYRIF